jgi:hypothetical protein
MILVLHVYMLCRGLDKDVLDSAFVIFIALLPLSSGVRQHVLQQIGKGRMCLSAILAALLHVGYSLAQVKFASGPSPLRAGFTFSLVQTSV